MTFSVPGKLKLLWLPPAHGDDGVLGSAERGRVGDAAAARTRRRLRFVGGALAATSMPEAQAASAW